jgi:DNA-binding transcriptional MocR family regulator
MVARLSDGADEAAAVTACRTRGLAVAPLAAYYAGEPPREGEEDAQASTSGSRRMTGLVMGFAGTPASLATDTAKRLEAALRAARQL